MIDIQEATKSFKGNIVIQNLNLQVGEGEILGLLGANGAGKSTTINMLLGFLSPDSGTVQINQMDCTKNPKKSANSLATFPKMSISILTYQA